MGTGEYDKPGIRVNGVDVEELEKRKREQEERELTREANKLIGKWVGGIGGGFRYGVLGAGAGALAGVGSSIYRYLKDKKNKVKDHKSLFNTMLRNILVYSAVGTGAGVFGGAIAGSAIGRKLYDTYDIKDIS